MHGDAYYDSRQMRHVENPDAVKTYIHCCGKPPEISTPANTKLTEPTWFHLDTTNHGCQIWLRLKYSSILPRHMVNKFYTFKMHWTLPLKLWIIDLWQISTLSHPHWSRQQSRNICGAAARLHGRRHKSNPLYLRIITQSLQLTEKRWSLQTYLGTPSHTHESWQP